MSPELYTGWRAAALDEPALHEEDASAIPSERLLQQVWLHQRLRRDALRTFDGRPLVVLHPGFWNRESGPDFKRAVVQIGDDTPVSGDVEVDLRPNAWHLHGHDRNPNFRDVCLHVVWRGAPADPCELPTLPLADLLDAPLNQLRLWLGDGSSNDRLTWITGACAPPLHENVGAALPDLLDQAALFRLQLKAEQLAARARQAGWEQALWEAAFTTLGYKRNPWPMRRLGELRAHLVDDLDPGIPPPLEIQARLLGLAGLLPNEPTRRWPETDAWLQTAWNIWWRWRDTARIEILPRAAWRFDGLRPANHPQRRLALASHWLANPGWPTRFERWLTADLTPTQLEPRLTAELQPPPDPFWSAHWTLRSKPMAQPQPLLGAARVSDLAMNAILPWLWSRARVSGNSLLQRRVEDRYRAWPAAADNAVLRLARQRLLDGHPLPRPVRACHQQGLLQIVRDFCDHSNALCDHCRFPTLVRRLARPAPSPIGC